MSGETVFTLPGAYDIFGDMRKWLRGDVCTADRNIVPVRYNTVWLGGEQDLINGAELLDTLMLARSGPKIVLSQSRGTLVAMKWLENYSLTSTIPSTDLEFIMTGNSGSKYGGWFVCHDWVGAPLTSPTPMFIPNGNPYDVLEIKNQHDGWSDGYDNWQFRFDYPDGQANLLEGMSIYHQYWDTNMNDPNAIDFTGDVATTKVTYRWIPTYPIATLYNGKSMKGWTRWKDQKFRPLCEKPYEDLSTRPIGNIPIPDYCAV